MPIIGKPHRTFSNCVTGKEFWLFIIFSGYITSGMLAGMSDQVRGYFCNSLNCY